MNKTKEQQKIINQIVRSITEIYTIKITKDSIIYYINKEPKTIARYNFLLADRITNNLFLDDYPKIIRFSRI